MFQELPNPTESTTFNPNEQQAKCEGEPNILQSEIKKVILVRIRTNPTDVVGVPCCMGRRKHARRSNKSCVRSI